jgi:hypothetical protein
MEEICKNCKFWKVAEEVVGHCRRYPPQVDPMVASTDPFPLTKSTDWCGEFRGVPYAVETLRDSSGQEIQRFHPIR